MMNLQRKFGLLCGLLAVVVALAAGCAQERDPIDRVQPNVVKKAMLQGQWYFHEKIVETPGGTLSNAAGRSQPVVGWYSAPQRIGFHIDEKFLYIRRVEENVTGTDSYAQEWDEDQVSDSIVAAFRIEKHFDVQRDYNPVTGESMNVVGENAHDRPWQERDYIRVDWSMNLSPNFELGNGFLTAMREPVNFYVQDECSPDEEFANDPEDRCVPDSMAPFFDIVWNEDGSDLAKGYFDITTASVLKDKDVYLPGYGWLPYCWLAPAGDCSDIIYYHRNSFWKIVPEEHDFEPLSHKGAITGQFGFFASGHLNYDESDGVKEPGRDAFAARHNIWEQSHTWNKPGADGRLDMSGMTANQVDALFNDDDPMLCRSSADCCPVYDANSPESEAGCRSICDVYTPLLPEHRTAYEEAKSCQFRVTPQNLTDDCGEVRYCTIPYDERRVRPIVYYVNDTWPEELIRRPGELGEEIDDASAMASKWAYLDEDEDDYMAPSVVEQVSEQWSAPLVRSINILKRKASGDDQTAAYANVPQIDDGMRRLDPGKRVQGRGDFTAIGTIDQSANNGFDVNWYDSERPPFTICRFAPVLGPNDDPNGVEPDICWERIQERSNCVFDPQNPGIDPKTGQTWEAARGWPICSAREIEPRLGDIRHSMLYWVEEPYNFGLLGLGPNHTDRTTGETLAGVAHIYAVNNTYTQGVVDKTLLLTGDLDSRSYIDGYTLKGFHDNYTGHKRYSQTSPSTGYGYGQMGSSSAGVNSNLEKPSEIGMATGSLSSYAISDGVAAVANVENAIHGTLGALESMTGGLNGDGFLDYLQVSDDGAVVESALGNSQLDLAAAAALGIDPSNNGLSADALADMLMFTRDNPLKLERALEQERNWISENLSGCFWLADMPNEGEASLAIEIQKLKRKDPDYFALAKSSDVQPFRNATWRYLRKNIVRAVVAHEIGHSIGLRHNFGGSQDYVNYREEYWDIRTDGCADVDYDDPDFDLTNPYLDPDTLWDTTFGCNNAEPNVGPRFIKNYPGDPEWDGDPISQYEVANQIHNYANGSIMDYAGKAHLDKDGVERYDWAALLYGYGHHMEVYQNIPTGSLSVHEALRPGFISDKCEDQGHTTDECRGIIYDDMGMFDDATHSGVAVGALVVNLRTGEESHVQSINADNIVLVDAEKFAEPMSVGDKYAVWGNPVGLNVSTFADKANLDDFMQWPYLLGRYQQGRGAPLVSLYEYFYAPHYTEFARQWPSLGFNDQDNRDVRDVREFNWKLQSQGNAWESGMYADGFSPGTGEAPSPGSVRVPYVFCTDQNADFSNSCNRHDYGTDDWERMNHHIESWEQGYLSGSFVRGKIGYDASNYMGRNVGRIYQVPKNFNNIYVLYREIFSGLYDERQLEAMTIDGFNSWGGYTMAVHDAFNMLMRTLATPDAGAGYSIASRPENGDWAMTADVSLGQGNGAIDVESGGRVFDTRYGNVDGDNACGADIWGCLWNVGWFYDKMAALINLTDSRAYFLGYDSSHDIRTYRISFLDDFNWQLKRAFSAMMGENWSDWSPVVVGRRNPTSSQDSTYVQLRDDIDYVDTNIYNQEDGLIIRTSLYDREVKQPVLFWRNWANPAADITNPTVFMNYDETMLPADVKADLLSDVDPEGVQWVQVDPTFRFTNKMYGLLYGMAGFQSNFDMSFYNSMRMWTYLGEEPLGVDPADIVTYYDPQSNMEYRAVGGFAPDDTKQPFSFPNPGEKEEGVAAAMLKHANELRARSSQCDPLFDPTDALIPDLASWVVSPTRATDAIGMMTVDEFVDDCCDNPYDPMVSDVATGDVCATDLDCVGNYDERGAIRAYCDNTGVAPTMECYVTDNCVYPEEYKALLVDPLGIEYEVDVYGDPDLWERWDSGTQTDVPVLPGTPEYDKRMSETRANWEIEHLRTDDYLQAHRGLVDFLVKLSRVFDEYLGYLR